MLETALAAVRQAKAWEEEMAQGRMKKETAQYIGASAAEALRGLEKRFGLKRWEKENDQREEHNEDLNEIKVTVQIQIEEARRVIINALAETIKREINRLEGRFEVIINATSDIVKRETARLEGKVDRVLTAATQNMDTKTGGEPAQLLSGAKEQE
ncbi:hypothetical protein BDZ91DRAFT_788235 [Kalaharituber pfeilii]|nr:hypothetical protein BDZ91DRAFT_788235 [Kalaharituber pfeilii]